MKTNQLNQLLILLFISLIFNNSCNVFDFNDLKRNNPCDLNNNNAIITGNPTPNFSYQRTGLTLRFINNSVNANEFLWTFGDGNESIENSPIHVYEYYEEGNYTVMLIAKNECISDTITKTIVLKPGCPNEPFANFSYSINGTTVTFHNYSVNVSSNSWNFGNDGFTSNESNPTYTYSGFGIYPVTLSVTNECGTSSATININVVDCSPQPQASFTYLYNNENTVSFTSNTLNATTIYWNFGNGITSTEANPIQTFTDVGYFTVVLSASNPCGTVSIEQQIPVLNFKDIRDGQIYPAVKLGNQIWMAANLNFGTLIESFNTSGTSGNCFGSNHPNNQLDNNTDEKYCSSNDINSCSINGGLYQWAEAMNHNNPQGVKGICPLGWHVPTDEEWKALEFFLGMPSDQLELTGQRGTDQGGQLVEGGSSGFKAKMTGYRFYEGGFFFQNNFAGFWTASSFDTCNAWIRYIQKDNPFVFRSQEGKFNAYCVRCVKD